MSLDIPDVVIQRLPQYLRSLRAFKNKDIALVSSTNLGAESGVTPAQIRKDLSYFGKFGKQGQGYNVEALTNDLTRILGLDQSWPVILLGVGRLGKAILTYPDFTPVFEQVKQESRRLGFLSVIVDPGGFRSGNLNRALEVGGAAEMGSAVVTLEKPRRRAEN